MERGIVVVRDIALQVHHHYYLLFPLMTPPSKEYPEARKGEERKGINNKKDKGLMSGNKPQ